MESLVKQENEPTDVSVKDHMLDQELLDAQAGADMAGMQSLHQWGIYNQLLAAGHDPDQAKDWVLEYVDPDPPREAPRFAVTDLGSANWVLKKMAELDAAQQGYEELLAAEIKALTDRAQEILKPLARKREFFELVYGKQLEEWTAEQIKDQKARSVKLLHGSVGFRKGQDKLVIDDEEKALKWAEVECPEAIKQSILLTPAKAGLLKQCPETKALKDVMHIEPGKDNFYIKPEVPKGGDKQQK